MYKFSFRKLLKEHESKYEPLGHEESTKIMEEILAMQIGFSADQVRSRFICLRRNRIIGL